MDSAESAGKLIAAVTGVWLLALALLAAWGTLIWRRVHRLPGTDAVFPSKSVPSVVMLVFLCLCAPLELLVWLPVWFFRVRRADGTSWSALWKVAYTAASVAPLFILAVIASKVLRLPGGKMTGLSLLWPPLVAVLVLLVAAVDAIVRRRRSSETSEAKSGAS